MSKFRLVLFAALAGAAVGVPGAGTAITQPLIATVGPGFNISLTDSTGAPVSHVDPGVYTITVHDKGNLHNFHLRGAGVDQATDVDALEEATWKVEFLDGKIYTYLCDAHPTQMRKTFTSGTVTTPPKKVRLFGRVGPGRAIVLRTASGAKVVRSPEGIYTISVSDRSRTDNFHLIGPHANRKTSVRGRGTTTWGFKLVKGLYRYRSDAHPKLAGSFRVV